MTTGFGSLRWGMTMEQVLAVYPRATTTPVYEGRNPLTHERVTVGGDTLVPQLQEIIPGLTVNATIAFNSSNRLVSIALWPDLPPALGEPSATDAMTDAERVRRGAQELARVLGLGSLSGGTARTGRMEDGTTIELTGDVDKTFDSSSRTRLTESARRPARRLRGRLVTSSSGHVPVRFRRPVQRPRARRRPRGSSAVIDRTGSTGAMGTTGTMDTTRTMDTTGTAGSTGTTDTMEATDTTGGTGTMDGSNTIGAVGGANSMGGTMDTRATGTTGGFGGAVMDGGMGSGADGGMGSSASRTGAMGGAGRKGATGAAR